MDHSARLSLGPAMRAHWWHLAPLPLFAPFTCYTVQLTNGASWSAFLIFAVFFVVTFYSYLPYMRGRVRMSFVHFGGTLYVFGGGLMYALCELLLWLLRHGAA